MSWVGLVPLEVPIDIDAAEARRRAVEELSKAKYVGVPPWLRDLFARILEWAEELARLILTPRGGPGGGVSWVLVVTLALLVGLIVLVVWKVGVPRFNARRQDATVGTDSTLPPQRYRSRAEAAAAAGDWLGAVRERFRGLVRSLEELTVLDVRPARTAWEVARLAGRQVPAVQPALDGAARVFNDVLYGDVVATEEAYRQLCGWDDEIVAAARSTDLVETEPVTPMARADDLTPTGMRR